MAYPYFWTERDLLKSAAYLALPFSARAALPHFYAKCQYEKVGGRRSKEFKHTNNGELVFTYKEAEALGFARPTFSKVLAELQNKGFIKLTLRGFGGVGEVRASSQFALSPDWKLWKGDGND